LAITSDSAVARELESRLHRPDKGENGYREGKETRTRVDTVKRLREFVEDGKIERENVSAGGINTHVHTSKSFAFFDSPSDAVWQAYLWRIAIFGINDHYTLAGHAEFGQACKALSIRPIFSLEAIAMWEEAEVAKHTVNDPTNPGRTYITAKAVTRPFPAGCEGAVDLERMNTALIERNQEMAKRLAKVFTTKLKDKAPFTWDQVIEMTPHGQPTERHLSLVAAQRLEKSHPDEQKRRGVVAKLTGEDVPDGVVADTGKLQDLLRARLLKVGKPAYVEESKQAFIPVERMVSLALDLGAIPTYPVLGDPVTPWEEDLDRLFDRLEALKIHAVEVIPDRNSRERLSAIVQKAAERSMPIFNGTEHNTKSPAPLVDRFFFDEEFRPHFERGARVALGHQALRAAKKEGYVREDGSLPEGSREDNLKRVEEASRRR
jgi:hypothetical protein